MPSASALWSFDCGRLRPSLVTDLFQPLINLQSMLREVIPSLHSQVIIAPDFNRVVAL